MGQNNSRNSPEHISHSTTTPPSGSTAAAAVAAPISSENHPSDVSSSPMPPSSATLIPEPTAKHSPRSSVRQSILDLVKRRTTTSDNDTARNAVNDSTSSTPASSRHSSRKRWRTSRRWSKARALIDPIQPDVENTASPDVVSPPVTSSEGTGKGKAKEDEGGVSTQPDVEAAVAPVNSATSQNTLDRPSTSFPYSSTNPIVDTGLSSVPSSSDSTSEGHSHTGEASDVYRRIGPCLGAPARGQASASSSNRLELSNGGTAEDVVIRPTTPENLHASESATTTRDISAPSSYPSPALTMPSTSPEYTEPIPSPSIPTRQFPPPGTLVVVQGVVHTTDVQPPPPAYDTPPSRSNLSLHQLGMRRRASSTPRPSTPVVPERSGNSTRNRLSALIPRSRPTSMLSPPSSDGDASGLHSNSSRSTFTPDSDHATVGGGNPGTASITRTSESRENDATREIVSNGPISSSSIDVLGTLLSVAAAATAASLLTGSSEPIFTSGLPHRPTDSSITQASPSITRPTSPTPTAGFGGLPFGLGSPESDVPPGQESGGARGRDRVRHAWGSLRERLGLRTANPPPVGASNEAHVPNRTRPDGTPMDAREVMLAEMARAFNLGLGLGGETNGDAGPSRPENEIGNDTGGENGDGPQLGSGPGRSSPPEDSFERFLMDLQTELRVVLSQPTAGGDDAMPHTSTTQQPGANNNSITPSSTTAPSTSTMLASVPVETDEEQFPAQDASDPDDEDEDRDAEDEDDSVTSIPDNDVPALIPSTSSNGILPSTDPAPVAPDINAVGGTPQATVSNSASRTEHRPGGGINWWRLYRFPPITSPHPQGIPATLSAMGSAPFYAPASDAMPLGSTTTAENASQTPSTEGRPNNAVIPVIVVGLQSVNMHRRRDQPTGVNEDIGANANDGLDDDIDFDGFPNGPENENGNGEAQRGRRWHSRAANAIRNLRPGRRGTSNRTQPGEGPGSRTFLIYVIGGYYPPDHHIVTGANTLDSFEALWDLAELLGQVKPPTATKEEIERSGLEVVKPIVLANYEKEGKVASNCTDKCLICLDDYAPEEDVRLLACRHAFHKNCVDKWLQTGRNNCPACRSRGVSTDDGPGVQPSTSAPV